VHALRLISWTGKTDRQYPLVFVRTLGSKNRKNLVIFLKKWNT